MGALLLVSRLFNDFSYCNLIGSGHFLKSWNLREWRNTVSSSSLWRGEVSCYLIDESCPVYALATETHVHFHILASHRCDHLFSPKGTLASVSGLKHLPVFLLNISVSSSKNIISRDCLAFWANAGWLSFFLREEDEYSELRSELSQSQHEVNEDSRSMDQDQTSLSIPENQSTMVTADMGECLSPALSPSFAFFTWSV